MKIFDGHSHLLNADYIQCLRRNGAEWEDGFPLPEWSIESHLAYMDSCGVDWSLLSLSSPHPCFGDAEECAAVCRSINEDAAGYKREYPDKIGFCAVLPLPDLKKAMEEAVYALDVLGADGIKLASNSRGLYLGDPALDPLMEELDRRGSVVIIHPHRPHAMTEGLFPSGPAPLFEFLCDTTRAVLNMMGHDIFRRYPDMKVVVPHCGSFLPNIADRFAGLQTLLVQAGVLSRAIDVKDSISRLYFDIAGSPVPDLLPLLLKTADPKHIIYGADYPFTPAQYVKAGLERLLQAFETDPTLRPYRDGILWENARDLFGLSEKTGGAI